ncbi:hypothetical protein B0E52_15625 [Rhodanobacter sp. C06]|uniref:DUF3247 family protein n=1 Tax=Rhodanobacter sp. C06 TaxID=1945854 RepID=UPI0009855F63|nr:DUF3247 family protein [Rhodanobacter sp. C06]OOG37700.1 hypothetical protein B0E52_15625 [Rhodanobacter sp. C06]
MSKQAPRICTTDADVGRLETLISQLPAHGRVVLSLRNGTTYTGVVKVRASTQVFRDPQGEEGINAVITLESPAAPHGAWNLWLDQVEHVEHLDSGLGGEN